MNNNKQLKQKLLASKGQHLAVVTPKAANSSSHANNRKATKQNWPSVADWIRKPAEKRRVSSPRLIPWDSQESSVPLPPPEAVLPQRTRPKPTGKVPEYRPEKDSQFVPAFQDLSQLDQSRDHDSVMAQVRAVLSKTYNLSQSDLAPLPPPPRRSRQLETISDSETETEDNVNTNESLPRTDIEIRVQPASSVAQLPLSPVASSSKHVEQQYTSDDASMPTTPRARAHSHVPVFPSSDHRSPRPERRTPCRNKARPPSRTLVPGTPSPPKVNTCQDTLALGLDSSEGETMRESGQMTYVPLFPANSGTPPRELSQDDDVILSSSPPSQSLSPVATVKATTTATRTVKRKSLVLVPPSPAAVPGSRARDVNVTPTRPKKMRLLSDVQSQFGLGETQPVRSEQVQHTDEVIEDSQANGYLDLSCPVVPLPFSKDRLEAKMRLGSTWVSEQAWSGQKTTRHTPTQTTLLDHNFSTSASKTQATEDAQRAFEESYLVDFILQNKTRHVDNSEDECVPSSSQYDVQFEELPVELESGVSRGTTATEWIEMDDDEEDEDG